MIMINIVTCVWLKVKTKKVIIKYIIYRYKRKTLCFVIIRTACLPNISSGLLLAKNINITPDSCPRLGGES